MIEGMAAANPLSLWLLIVILTLSASAAIGGAVHLSVLLKRLRVEIDNTKREETVREITETDFFADLAAKAEDLRGRMHRK